MEMNEKVSIIVVHYGMKRMLSKCLNSILQQTYNNYETIIVNNSKSKLRNFFFENLNKTVINNQKNEFYSTALNQGIRKSNGEYVLILNNDVILEKEFISSCVRAIKRDKTIGIISGKILRRKGKRFDSTGQRLSKYRKPIERGYKELDKGQYNSAAYIFGACGAAAFLRKEMLEEIKVGQDYFCDEFKMFYEDLDLNWRANNEGWKGYYTPNAVAYHQRGSSTQEKYYEKSLLSGLYFYNLPSELKFHVIKNRYMTIIRNERIKDFIYNIFWIVMYDFALWSLTFITSPSIVLKFKTLTKYFSRAFNQRELIGYKSK